MKSMKRVNVELAAHFDCTLPMPVFAEMCPELTEQD